ncbi:testis-specific gene A8 protein-like [Drosophila innubila]|uniref:testis-specific gene A8 protein-like n=1 Tax=Drosophila innubila TaxID=198719 RepID=UPI00148E37E6|nr:testis-specific gene A8 protein-like [Drosophila innubila]
MSEDKRGRSSSRKRKPIDEEINAKRLASRWACCRSRSAHRSAAASIAAGFCRCPRSCSAAAVPPQLLCCCRSPPLLASLPLPPSAGSAAAAPTAAPTAASSAAAASIAASSAAADIAAASAAAACAIFDAVQKYDDLTLALVVENPSWGSD